MALRGWEGWATNVNMPLRFSFASNAYMYQQIELKFMSHHISSNSCVSQVGRLAQSNRFCRDGVSLLSFSLR